MVDNEFQFKVKTVKWFGILSAAIVLIFLAAGYFYFDRLITAATPPPPRTQIPTPIEGSSSVEIAPVVLSVEVDALQMRNARAVSALSMRTYLLFLSVVLGSVLALIGAVFVLARVDATPTDSDLKGLGLAWTFKTSSPGIIITVIGSILIAFVVYSTTKEQIVTNDLPMFMSRGLVPRVLIGDGAQAVERGDVEAALERWRKANTNGASGNGTE